MRLFLIFVLMLSLSGCSLPGMIWSTFVKDDAGLTISPNIGDNKKTVHVGETKTQDIKDNKGQVAGDSIHNSTGTGYTINQNTIPITVWLSMSALIMLSIFLTASFIVALFSMPPKFVLKSRLKKMQFMFNFFKGSKND